MADRPALGLLGGTFDPVHYGHLRLAESAAEALALDTVRWIPAGDPRHRLAPEAPACHRLEMVSLAIAGNPRFELDPAEVHSLEPSYTVPTLERLRRELGGECALVLLLGIDAFLGLLTWHRWPDLLALAHIAVGNRPGRRTDAGAMPAELQRLLAQATDAARLRDAAAGAVAMFEMTPLEISATDIRARLAAGRSARYLLPDPVLAYIRRNRLYSIAPHGC
jgi:nicotinate-nucleotide adenylyltransferase